MILIKTQMLNLAWFSKITEEIQLVQEVAFVELKLALISTFHLFFVKLIINQKITKAQI